MPESNYLTAEGAKRLTEELEYLKGPAREKLAERLRAAIQQGDLSENADYHAAKEEQGFLEGRIIELDQILHNAVIIDDMEKNPDEVGIGCYVTIQEEDYPPETYHMVGPKRRIQKICAFLMPRPSVQCSWDAGWEIKSPPKHRLVRLT
jgi:transcription elongation factor GreA